MSEDEEEDEDEDGDVGEMAKGDYKTYDGFRDYLSALKSERIITRKLKDQEAAEAKIKEKEK